jgi:hypothetical protein
MKKFVVPSPYIYIDRAEAIAAEKRVLSGQYTQKDAECLLSYSHAQTYAHVLTTRPRAIVEDVTNGPLAKSAEHFFTYDGLCAVMSFSTSELFDSMHIENYRKDMGDITNEICGHVVDIVHFKSGDFEQSYLVDNTLIQFFPHDTSRGYDARKKNATGRSFNAYQETRALASVIIAQGWTPLDDRTIYQYCFPFRETATHFECDCQVAISDQKKALFSKAHCFISPKEIAISPEYKIPSEFYALKK